MTVAGLGTESIRCLRSGVVPSAEIESLSVGYDGIRDLLLERIVTLGETGRVTPLFVRGEWGTGKSHFISYARTLCRELEVASSVVTVNARGNALNHPQRSYPQLAENVECGRFPSGLQGVLTAVVGDESLRSVLQQGVINYQDAIDVNVRRLCESWQNGLMVAEHPAWTPVLGGDICWGNYQYQRQRALQRIGDLARFFTVLAARGLVLLFDEVETIDQLHDVRSRKGAYTVLGHLARMKHTWSIFAITARFERTIEKDIDRGLLQDAKLTESAQWFLRAWLRDTFDVVTPPVMNLPKARILAERVNRLYRRVYTPAPEQEENITGVVERWAQDPARNPRTLIRSVVDLLDRQRPVVP